VVGTAQRELLEELGFEVARSQLLPLGPSTFPAPGIVSERQFFFHVAVDPNLRRAPELDGSPLERFGEVIDVPLSDALAWCTTGGIEDVKTEIGLRRFADIIARRRPSD
jgi:ADP-ribose pyrophosphatase